MAIPVGDWNLTGLLKQAAQDFLFVPPDVIKPKGYSAEQLEKLWYPDLVGATEQRIKTNLGHINVTHGGKPDGVPLVLWPSLMLKGSVFSYQWEYFRHTHRMVLIDSPGINKSDALRKYISLEDCCQCLVDILDALKIDKCVFGGNSWGAMLGVVVPAWIPERLLGVCAMNGTASLPTTPETIMMTLRMEALMLNEHVPDWWCSIAQQAFAGETAAASNPEFMAYLGTVSREDPKSLAWALRGILIGRPDRHELLKTTKDVPVLVVAGAEDRQFPVEKVKKMADAISTSKFVISKGAHLIAREVPDEVNEIMETFLKEIGAM